MAAYSSRDYWNKRYEKDKEPFDWYQRYDMIRKDLGRYLSKSDKILIVGCGTSTMGEGLWEDGYRDVTCIDYSETAIAVMNKRSQQSLKTGLRYVEMDITKMSFSDASFDVVIDKATFDSLLCGESSNKTLAAMLQEIHRVLRPQTGKYLLISHGKKQQRLSILERPQHPWSNIDVQKVNKPSFVQLPLDQDDSFHFLYICTVGQVSAAQDSSSNENNSTSEL